MNTDEGFRRGDVYFNTSGEPLGIVSERSLSYRNFPGGYALRHDYCQCYMVSRIVEVRRRKIKKGGGQATYGYSVADELGHYETHKEAVQALLTASKA